MKIYLSVIVVVLFSSVCAFASPSITTSTVDDLIKGLQGTDEQKKTLYLGYFNGALDATMSFGLHLKIWCFPNPMPSREEFLKEYLKDYESYSATVGAEAASKMQMDQMLFMSWGQKYLCPKVNILH